MILLEPVGLDSRNVIR